MVIEYISQKSLLQSVYGFRLIERDNYFQVAVEVSFLRLLEKNCRTAI